MLRTLSAMALTGVLLTAPVHADDDAEKKLTIGDAAPKLDVAHWVKGTPPTAFENGKVYVVEFWATWCGPCRTSMPHISKLQEKYQDYGVQVLSISSEKELSTVTEFLKKPTTKDEDATETWTDRMRYTVGVDPDRSVSNDYMRAAGRNGIPCAFIVGKDGKIDWIGHPAGMDRALDDVVHDRWNRAQFKVEFQMQQELAAARRNPDPKPLEAALTRLLDASPNSANVLMELYMVRLTRTLEPKQAYALNDRLYDAIKDNSMQLNSVAWTIADDAAVTMRDFGFALKAAERANELTQSSNAAILDTLARVHYERGDLDLALKYQRLALQHVENDSMRTGIEAALEKYEKAAKKK